VSKRIFEAGSNLLILAFLPILAAGCSGATPTAPMPVPAATEVVMAISDEQLASAAAIGDIAAGEELFKQPVDGVQHSLSCSTCHSLDGKATQDGPTLAGISAVAAVRVAGMSDVDYLRQSIVDPAAFRVGGEWRFPMPHQYADLLSEDQINNLIAFLLTR